MCRDQSSVRSDEKEKRDLAEKLDLMLHVCFFICFFYFQVIRGGGVVFVCEGNRSVGVLEFKVHMELTGR